MSDFNPNQYDKFGNAKFEPASSAGGPYVLLAILVLIGLVGGLLYFNGAPKGSNEDLAKAPGQTTPVRPDRGPVAAPTITPTPSVPDSVRPSPVNPPKQQD